MNCAGENKHIKKRRAPKGRAVVRYLDLVSLYILDVLEEPFDAMAEAI